MKKGNSKQDQLDELHRRQYELEQKIDDLDVEYRQFKVVREDVMSSQGSALFHFKNLLDLGVTSSHSAFYHYLLDDIESTTRTLEVDFEEEDKAIKKRYQAYQTQLTVLQDHCKKMTNDNDLLSSQVSR